MNTRKTTARRPRGYKADRGGMSYNLIENHALNARRQLAPETPLDGALEGVALFENLDRWEFHTARGLKHCTYGVSELPYGTEARTQFEQGTDTIVVELDRETYAALEGNQGRARHTLYHEIGPLVLHTDQLLRISVIPHAQAEMARTAMHQFCEDTEWQADSFAAAFAMPAQGLLALELRYGQLNIPMIVWAMKVSQEAATNRFNTFITRKEQLLRAH